MNTCTHVYMYGCMHKSLIALSAQQNIYRSNISSVLPSMIFFFFFLVYAKVKIANIEKTISNITGRSISFVKKIEIEYECIFIDEKKINLEIVYP